MVDVWDAADDARRIGTRVHTVGELFAIEQTLLAPLPDEPFETGIWLGPRVDRYSQVTVRTNRYSVPARLVGRQVRVHLHASHLVIYDGRVEVARHERLMAKGGTRLDLDHYLEALLRKPGAPGQVGYERASPHTEPLPQVPRDGLLRRRGPLIPRLGDVVQHPLSPRSHACRPGVGGRGLQRHRQAHRPPSGA